MCFQPQPNRFFLSLYLFSQPSHPLPIGGTYLFIGQRRLAKIKRQRVRLVEWTNVSPKFTILKHSLPSGALAALIPTIVILAYSFSIP